MSSSKCVQEAVKNIDAWSASDENKMRKQLLKNPRSTWTSGHEVVLDASEELNAEDADYCQHLVGVAQWIVELGRIDVIPEASTLSSYLANPHHGHMDAALHLCSWLKNHHNARLILDPSYPDIDQDSFIQSDWENFHGNIKEELPPDMPKPLGKDVDLRLHVDSSHASGKVNGRSRTGFFVFLNSALIQWCSKKQPAIESSVFGAEFVAVKHGIETMRGVGCKLKTIGVPLSGATCVQ